MGQQNAGALLGVAVAGGARDAKSKEDAPDVEGKGKHFTWLLKDTLQN